MRSSLKDSLSPLSIDVRSGLICFAAVSAALPIAFVSSAKILLVLWALAILTAGWLGRAPPVQVWPGLTTPVILLTLAVMAASGLWSTGTLDDFLTAIVKHGKLILIPVFLCLIRSRRQAKMAVAWFVAGQVFLLLSTWLMFMGASVPWAMSDEAGKSYAVFSSYLDQSVMTAVLAAVCWHLRPLAPARYTGIAAVTISGLALTAVFFIFQGRTGFSVAIALLSMAILWELPKRFRFPFVFVPVVLVLVLSATSDRVRAGLTEIVGSIASYSTTVDIGTSSAVRIELWRQSIRSIEESPWHGTGAGSWDHEFMRQQTLEYPLTLLNRASTRYRNPHQEYLLWGVELGLPGIALLGALLLALYRDSLGMARPERRAMQSILLALALASAFNCALFDALIGDFFCIGISLLAALGLHRTAAPGRLPDA